MTEENYGYWIFYGFVLFMMLMMGTIGATPSQYRSERERRNWARCAWLAPIWPAVVGWFVSKWLGMFVAFMWRTAWPRHADVDRSDDTH